MSTRSEPTSDKVALGAGIILLTATVLHILDHVRQGRPLPGVLSLVGATGLVLAVVSILLALRHHPLVRKVNLVVGFGTVAGLAAVHVLPHWSVFSDPYPEVHVDGLAWTSLIALMVAAGALGMTSFAANKKP